MKFKALVATILASALAISSTSAFAGKLEDIRERGYIKSVYHLVANLSDSVIKRITQQVMTLI